MARGRGSRVLNPTDLPSDAPERLRAEYEEAKSAVATLRRTEREVAQARERTATLVERYELSYLQHMGQLTLFGGEDEASRTHE